MATKPEFDAQSHRPLLLSRFGATINAGPYVVERDAIAQYAAATNDPDELGRNGDRSTFAFAVVPPLSLIEEQAHRIVADPDTAVYLHGSHRVSQCRRLLPGDRITSSCTVIGLHPSAIGAVMVTRIVCTDAEEELVNEQWCATIVRSHETGAAQGDEFPACEPLASHPLEWGQVTQRFDADQTYRYSDASGDLAQIHLSEDVARAAGLPGIIIQGMCSLAFAAVAVTEALCPEAPHTLDVLACRFRAPAFPGSEMTTHVSLTSDRKRAGFTSRIGGKDVLTRGFAARGKTG